MGILKNLLQRRQATPAPRPNPSDRRRHPRYRVMQPTAVYVTDRPMRVTLMDISRSGARVCTRFPREAAGTVGLTLEVDDVQMIVPLRLVWETFSDGLYEYGGEFVNLSAREASHVQAFIAKMAVQVPRSA